MACVRKNVEWRTGKAAVVQGQQLHNFGEFIAWHHLSPPVQILGNRTCFDVSVLLCSVLYVLML